MSGKSKNTLKIKNWIGEESLELELNEGFSIISRTRGATQSNKLTVSRKSDKYSNRIGLMAYLRRSKPGYETLGFSEIILTIDRYADSGRFLSRTVMVFSPVGVDSLTPNNGEETIVFAFGTMSEMTVSRQGVSFN